MQLKSKVVEYLQGIQHLIDELFQQTNKEFPIEASSDQDFMDSVEEIKKSCVLVQGLTGVISVKLKEDNRSAIMTIDEELELIAEFEKSAKNMISLLSKIN